ncbi:MAG: efflux RND transporter permease subunit [Pirellulales bacterium]
MSLLASIVRNPVKVAVGVLLLLLFGTDALFRLPMQLTPEVETPKITVYTRWMGASPQEVEREIVRAQEEQLKSVEGMTKMSSESRDSESRIVLEFLVGTEMSEALLKVSSRLQQVPDYPEDAKEPVISASDINDRSIAWFILNVRMPEDERLVAFQRRYPQWAPQIERVRDAGRGGLALLRLRKLADSVPEIVQLLPDDIDLTRLRRFADNTIEARFERVPGVANAGVSGGLEDEMQVIVDPTRLAARQLTFADVRQALRGENKDTSGGDFWEGKRRYVVRTLGQFRSEQQVADQILAMRDGAPVYLRDVADVRLGYKRPRGVVRRFGASSISVSVQRETGANVLDVMDGLRAAAAELNEKVLKQRGLHLTQVYDETEYIDSAVGLVKQNIVVGGLLTIGVLLLFLRSGRATLVIGLAIPTSIIGTFLVLDLMGRSLNVVSLAGLAFAVGMLVDNAVVVLENIYRHVAEGENSVTAAVRGTAEVWGAVVASTLTTLAVFVPVLFVQEEAGQLFGDIALAISAAVGLSLVVSVTVIPTAAARLLATADRVEQTVDDGPLVSAHGEHVAGERRPIASSTLGRHGRSFVDSVVSINRLILETTGRRLAVLAALVGFAALSVYVFWPKVEYLPSGNRNLVFASILPPPGYNLDRMMELGETLENQLQPYWDVDPNSPRAAELDYPPIRDFFFIARGRRVFMGLRSANPTRAGKYVDLFRQVAEDLPGTIVTARQSSLFERGLEAGRNVDIEITGPDLRRLTDLGRRIMDQVVGTDRSPGILPEAQVRPFPSLDLSNPEIQLIPKAVQAAETHIDATNLGYTVDALIDGAYACDYFLGGERIDLRIIGSRSFTRHTQDLRTLPVATPTGQLVSLATLADVKMTSGPEQINHRERSRAITIRVTPPVDVPLEVARDQIDAEIVRPLVARGELAGGYAVRLGGTVDKLQRTWRALDKSFWVAILVTYLLMAALFESWIYPLAIILSLPVGLVGGLIGLKVLNLFLALTDQPPQALDVLTMLGFVILVGTVVNNAILIVHQSLNYLRSEPLAWEDAILRSVRTRIRPIFMTTATTVLGLMPLVVFPGAGSELYRGLGSVVLGGLLLSSIFTLVLVPTLFSLLVDGRHYLGRAVRAGGGRQTGTSRTLF